jgi:hypothetical protein
VVCYGVVVCEYAILSVTVELEVESCSNVVVVISSD